MGSINQITSFVSIILAAGLSFSACTTKTAEIKSLIEKKERRSGVAVEHVEITNDPDFDKGLFTVKYSVDSKDQMQHLDSIKINQTKDEILSEFF